MRASIITIGDEILIGQIVDTNSAFIAKAFNNIGIQIYQITSVQDDRKHILKALQEAEESSDIVLLTGGLGPTKDDITKKTIADYFDDSLVYNDDVLNNIKRIWEKYIKKPLLQVNIDQSLVPSKATVLMNKFGTAPGMWLERNGTIFISMPGVPYEMKALIEYEVIPRLMKLDNLPVIKHTTLLTYGMGESMIAARIETWENNLPEFVKLAYLPSLGRVRLRLSAKGTDKDFIDSELSRLSKELEGFVSDIFKGYEEEATLEQQVAKLLIQNKKTLATAESCTGGKIAEVITSAPGASAFFKGSIISYATEVKHDVLNVDEELIKKYGVVSEEVAYAMAEGVQKLLRTDFAITTTGNAGPTKGDQNVEVGTVCMAIASPNAIKTYTFTFGNHRTRVIQKSVNKAFELLQTELLNF
ncbi:MAG: competence/damage-inducible protein A [bacterium]